MLDQNLRPFSAQNSRWIARLIIALVALDTTSCLANETRALPIGRWVAEHPSAGGIGSWWDFRADGTFSVSSGAMVTVPIGRDGALLTLPPATVDGTPSKLKYRIEKDILFLLGDDKELRCARVGPALSRSDPLLGKWKLLSADPLVQTTPQTLYIFSSNGTESVRIAFTTRDGHWDESTHTFQLEGDPVSYSYKLEGTKLVLAQPRGGSKTDSYVPDPTE